MAALIRGWSSSRSISICVAHIALAASAFAQARVQWESTYDETYGFMAHYAEAGTSCAIAPDGHVFVAAPSSYDNSSSGGGYAYQVAILSYTSTGALSGVRRVGPTPPAPLAAPKVIVDAASDSYTAWTSQGGPTVDVVLTKMASNGTVAWTQTYDSNTDYALDLEFAGNGDVLVAALTSPGPSFTLLNYSPGGALQWTAPIVFAGSSTSLTDMAVAPAGDVVFVGSAINAKAVKLSPSGAPLWSVAFDMGLGALDRLVAVDVDAGGHSACAGYSQPPGVLSVATLALLDAAGNVTWTRSWLPAPYTTSYVRDVVFASDGTIWACGNAPTGGAGAENFVLHYDRAGVLLAQQTWPGQAYGPMQIVAGNAGDVRVCGGDPSVRQFDAGGQLDWISTSSSPTFQRAHALTLGPNATLVITGQDSANSGDVRTIQLDLGESPSGYCTAKVNSLGCTPNLVFSGGASASATSGFTISIGNVLNQRGGLLFYGLNGSNNAPFQGGFLCVQPPTRRTPVANSGGNPSPPDDCSGVFAIDMNAFASGALGGSPAPELAIAGTRVWCQQWSRDPASPSTTNLSSAVNYVVLP